MIHEMKKALVTNSFDMLPKYMQKKSIKQRLRKNITMTAVYRWLYKFGIKDINIMNNIVDEISPKAFRQMQSNMCDPTENLLPFIHWLLEGRNAESIKAIIINAFENDYHLRDSARMYAQALAAGVTTIDNSGNIREIHDRIMHEYNRMRFRNRVISYDKTEKRFEQTVDDYQFILAEDTDRLYDIGNNLRICVGSYGENAVAKRCTIITMQKDNNYVACIELRKQQGQWYMNQLKAKFNHTVQEIEPVIKWVESTGIKVDTCSDYTYAVNHKRNGFDDREHDYHVDNPRLRDENNNAHNVAFDWDWDDGPF